MLKCDEEGVPYLVQKIRVWPRAEEAKLEFFDGTIIMCDLQSFKAILFKWILNVDNEYILKNEHWFEILVEKQHEKELLDLWKYAHRVAT